MTTIDIRSNVDKIAKNLEQIHKKHIPYAIRLTVNKLAENSKRNMDMKEIPKLDRPTRYAQNMMRVQYANRTNITSTVKVKDTALLTKRGAIGPDQVLGHLFTGGQRRGKGFEGLMQRAGILPKGMYVVPGEGVQLDSHGNIPRGLIIQLVAYFRAFQGGIGNSKDRRAIERRVTKKHFKGASSTEFFLVRNGDDSKLHPGIWARVGFGIGKATKPILIFVNRTIYKQYFDLPATVDMIIDRDFDFEFGKAFEYALATAK